jgi:TPR repeat protein
MVGDATKDQKPLPSSVFEYAKLAADEENRLGLYIYGLLNLRESAEGTESALGFDLMQELAEESYSLGEFACGVCCLFGYATTQNRAKGAALLARAAAHACPELMLRMGIALLNEGGQRYEVTAAGYIFVGAKAGTMEGQTYYGWVLENGIGIKRDTEAEWYTKAVEMG